jgi:hypothetical protein
VLPAEFAHGEARSLVMRPSEGAAWTGDYEPPVKAAVPRTQRGVSPAPRSTMVTDAATHHLATQNPLLGFRRDAPAAKSHALVDHAIIGVPRVPALSTTGTGSTSISSTRSMTAGRPVSALNGSTTRNRSADEVAGTGLGAIIGP